MPKTATDFLSTLLPASAETAHIVLRLLHAYPDLSKQQILRRIRPSLLTVKPDGTVEGLDSFDYSMQILLGLSMVIENDGSFRATTAIEDDPFGPPDFESFILGFNESLINDSVLAVTSGERPSDLVAFLFGLSCISHEKILDLASVETELSRVGIIPYQGFNSTKWTRIKYWAVKLGYVRPALGGKITCDQTALLSVVGKQLNGRVPLSVLFENIAKYSPFHRKEIRNWFAENLPQSAALDDVGQSLTWALEKLRLTSRVNLELADDTAEKTYLLGNVRYSHITFGDQQ